MVQKKFLVRALLACTLAYPALPESFQSTMRMSLEVPPAAGT